MPEVKTETIWVNIPFHVVSDTSAARAAALAKVIDRCKISPWSSTQGWTIAQSSLHSVVVVAGEDPHTAVTQS